MERFLSEDSLETNLRAALPGDLASLERDRVIESLASGLAEIAAKARR